MDIKQFGEKGVSLIKKYKYVVLVLIVGVVLMLMPTTASSKQSQLPANQTQSGFEDPTKELQKLLSQIQGAGDVQLMLTLAAGEKVIYQTDSEEDETGTGVSVQVETVIVTDSSRTENGLIQQIIAPQYRGAVVVCDGADDPAVKYALMEAVKNATGLGFDRISVLKMK